MSIKARAQIAQPTETKEIIQREKTLEDLNPDFVQEMMRDAGMGVSTRPSDNITPSIKVLQPLSPQVLAGPTKITGAKAGDFLLADTLEIFDGQEGFWFQPVAMTEWWFEFIPRARGGGFVRRLLVKRTEDDEVILPQGVERDPENANHCYFMETDNNCTHYRFIPGMLWREGNGMEYVIPFFSTGHTVARSWNTKWMRLRFPNGKLMPAFSHLYHVTTKMKTNIQGSWHMIETSKPHLLANMTEVLGDPYAAYRMGRALALAFASGALIESADVDVVDANESIRKQNVKDSEDIPF